MIDFRNTDAAPGEVPLSREFQLRFESALSNALRNSGITVTVLFRATKDSLNSDREVRALEKESPHLYYATTLDIARTIREQNRTVPIVFSGIVHPKEAELVGSIPRPDTNMTGFVSYADVDDKRIELLASLNPQIRRIGIVLYKGSYAETAFPARQAFAKSRGLEVFPLEVHERTDPEVVIDRIRALGLDALDAPTSRFVRMHYRILIAHARKARIPISFRSADWVKRGGVLSYEPREFDYPVKAAAFVARILRGTKPQDIPIEFPSGFTLSINETAIQRLPYTVDKSLLLRANQVFKGDDLK